MRSIDSMLLRNCSKTRLMVSLFLVNLYVRMCSYSLFPQWIRLYVPMHFEYFPSPIFSMTPFFNRTQFFHAMTLSVSRHICCSCLLDASANMLCFPFVLCWNKGQINDASVTKPWSDWSYIVLILDLFYST